ncbi:DUF45 domain-containing protein [Luteimonas sp. RD2P54]|uniref:DUF45 domain-containing protein n=1 Tax=Luteimonas endophytica TaxID=3042023 RepID=A0ABT6J5E1_9GAMM|nr:YgjP-like metallopeptidase domain-containing protein [Luteimonas endophytica]MDH5822047.1 DUF45 domain-containing protein [Luteimonas endophytica]
MPSPLRRLIAPRALLRDRTSVRLDDGREIEVERVRDPRARRLRLTVGERGARLTLPPRASLVAGQRFLHQHRDWLVLQLAAQDPDGIVALVPGESAALPLRGLLLPLRWEQGRYASLREDAGGITFALPPRAAPAALRRCLRDFYEAQARADIGRWLPRYLPALPRAPARIRLRPMSSQWGSLAANGVLSLDLSLVLGEPAAFEYVLVHELCHLIHADHSPSFWAEVEARCPEWRRQRAYFHAEGRRLKARLHALLSG